MRTRKRQNGTRCARRAGKAAALIVSLVVSAYVVAQAGATGRPAWIGWLALVPLFLVIRLWRPARATMAGALWGTCLYLFSVGRVDAPVFGTIPSLILLTAIPAAYACLAAHLTRWIGFSPLVLGVAWIGVELALGPMGLRTGLLGETTGDGSWLEWVGRAFGYVVVAFPVVLVNASLVFVLSAAYPGLSWHSDRIRPPDRGTFVFPRTFFCFSRFAILSSRPRAPPVRCLSG